MILSYNRRYGLWPLVTALIPSKLSPDGQAVPSKEESCIVQSLIHESDQRSSTCYKHMRPWLDYQVKTSVLKKSGDTQRSLSYKGCWPWQVQQNHMPKILSGFLTKMWPLVEGQCHKSCVLSKNKNMMIMAYSWGGLFGPDFNTLTTSMTLTSTLKRISWEKVNICSDLDTERGLWKWVILWWPSVHWSDGWHYNVECTSQWNFPDHLPAVGHDNSWFNSKDIRQ